jgi:hypothetical protein
MQSCGRESTIGAAIKPLVQFGVEKSFRHRKVFESSYFSRMGCGADVTVEGQATALSLFPLRGRANRDSFLNGRWRSS